MTERTNKTPLRMCIVCKEMKPKNELLRIVRNPEGEFLFDKSGKANGRGAYICAEGDCVERCLKKKLLNKAFKSNLDESVYAKLSEEYEFGKS